MAERVEGRRGVSLASIVRAMLAAPLPTIGAACVVAAFSPLPAAFIFSEFDSTPSGIGRLLALSIVGFCGRIVLAASSIAAVHNKPIELGPMLRRIIGRASPILRTRAIALMVTCAIAFLPLSLLTRLADRMAPSRWPEWIAVALAFVAAAWWKLGDRVALTNFNYAADQKAQDARETSRSMPHYQNTGDNRGGRGNASGADDAVSTAGLALLQTKAVAALAITFGLDLARAALPLLAAYLPALGPFIGALGFAAGVLTAIVDAALWTTCVESRSSLA